MMKPRFMDLRLPTSTKLTPGSLLVKEKRRVLDLRLRQLKKPGEKGKVRLTKLKNEEKMLEPRPRKLKKKKGNS